MAIDTRDIANANDIVADFRTHYSGDKDTCIADVQRYGDWDQGRRGPLVIPALLSGGDYAGTTLVQKSNHRAFSETFAKGEGAWWADVGGGYGTFAIVIDCGAVPEDMETEVTEFLGALSDYPLADEDLHSEMELEAQGEAWTSWARSDFRRALEEKFETDLDDAGDDALYQVFHDACERSNTYWENEQGDSMHIDMDRIVDAISAIDVADLQSGIVTGAKVVR